MSITEKRTVKPKSKHQPKLFECYMNNTTKIEGTTPITRALHEQQHQTEATTKFL